MRRLSLPLVLLVGTVLAGCVGGGGATPAPGSTATSTPTAAATPDDSATPTPDAPGPVAGFELSGSALIAVDADGDEVASHPLSDPRGVIDALTGLLGAPSDGPADEGCGVNVALWPASVGDVVVAYSPSGGGTPMVIVKSAAYGIRPSEGPGIGENALAFAGGLPAGHYEPGYAYVYDAVTTMGDGTPIGGVAFIDGSGTVVSLLSPSPPYGSGFC